MKVTTSILLIITAVFLFGCPKNDPSPDNDDREPITAVSINFEKDMLWDAECGKPFEIKGIPFLIEKTSNVSFNCYTPTITWDPKTKGDLRIHYHSEMTIDLSRYKNIKSIRLSAIYMGGFGEHRPEVILYDLNDKIITQKAIEERTRTKENPQYIDFKDGLSNIKKIVILGRGAELTQIGGLSIY